MTATTSRSRLSQEDLDQAIRAARKHAEGLAAVYGRELLDELQSELALRAWKAWESFAPSLPPPNDPRLTVYQALPAPARDVYRLLAAPDLREFEYTASVAYLWSMSDVVEAAAFRISLGCLAQAEIALPGSMQRVEVLRLTSPWQPGRFPPKAPPPPPRGQQWRHWLHDHFRYGVREVLRRRNADRQKYRREFQERFGTVSLAEEHPGSIHHGSEEALVYEDLLVDRAEDLDRRVLKAEWVQDLFSRLLPRERQILEGFYFGGYERREIAAAMGISTRRLRQIEHRAVERLRTLAAELGVSGDLGRLP